MIITAFTIAKDLEEAERLGIKKHYGDLCKDCNTLVRYTSNNNCVACSAKRKGGKSPKIPNKFFCKQHQEYFDMSLLGEKTRYYSLCKFCKENKESGNSIYAADRIRDRARQDVGRKNLKASRQARRNYKEKMMQEVLLALLGTECNRTNASKIAVILNNKQITDYKNRQWTKDSIYNFFKNYEKARRAARQKPAHLRTIVAP